MGRPLTLYILKHSEKVVLRFIMLAVVLPLTTRGQDLQQSLDQYRKQLPQERVFLETDRFSYAHGEVIWVSGLVLGMFDNTLSSKANELTVEIQGAEGDTYMVYNFPVEHGVVSASLVLSSSIPEGAVFLNAYTDHSMPDNPYRSMLVVHEDPLPDFRIRMAFPESAYFPGEAFTGRLFFTDHYNEPLKRVEYTIVVRNSRKTILHVEGKTNKEGMVDVVFDVPVTLADSRLYFTVEASGKMGSSQLSGLIPVHSEEYFSFVFPEGGNLLAGEESLVSVLVLDTFGRPFASQGMIVDGDGDVVQQGPVDASGFARFHFVPRSGAKYFFRLVKPFLSEKKTALPAVQEGGYNLILKGSVGNEVVLEATNTTGTNTKVTVLALDAGRLVYEAPYTLEEREIIRVDKDIFRGSYACFELLLAGDNEVVARRTVMTEPPDGVACRLQNQYQSTEMRDRVDFELDCRAEEVAGAFFSSVYTPWMEQRDYNPDLTALNTSIEFYAPLNVIHSTGVTGESGLVPDVSMALYPVHIGAQRIHGQQAEENWWETPELAEGRRLWATISAVNNRKLVDGTTSFDNISASGYFLTSNPGLLHALKKTVAESKPAYKTMLESGTEVLKVLYTIKPYQLEGGSKIVFYGSRNSLLFQQGALIVVDGVQLGEDASVLNNISPFDVDKIRVSTNPIDIQRYTGLNSVGLVEITTKRGGEEDPEDQGAKDAPESFESPDYSHHASRSRNDDLRYTLYWSFDRGPLRDVSPQSYYNPDIRGEVEVTWSLLFTDGRAEVIKTRYEVK